MKKVKQHTTEELLASYDAKTFRLHQHKSSYQEAKDVKQIYKELQKRNVL